MKEIIENIKSIYYEYLEEAKDYYNIIKDFFLDYKNIFRKINECFKNKKYRNNIIKFSICFTVLILLVLINTSLGYYYTEANIPITSNVVGDIYTKNYDYVLLIYKKNISDYDLTYDIPSKEYKYSGYKCKNNSVLIFDEDTRETSVDLLSKDVCSIYFDLENSLDIILNVMLENQIDSNTYSVGDNVPVSGYKYDHYECDSKGTLTYDSNLHKVNLSTKVKEKCNIYFKKVESDVTVNLFVENTVNKEDYIVRKTIPSGIYYSLNTERSYCTNKNGERKDANLNYTDGYINLNTDEITECSVYLNRNA